MFDVIKTSFSRFGSDRCTTLAASLAYYTIFSLPPLLFILLTTVTFTISWYYGGDAAEEKAFALMQAQVSEMLGNKAAEKEIGTIMKSNLAAEGVGWKTLVSITGILFGATGVVASLQSSLNLVWRIKPDPKRSGFKDFVIKRLLSFGMILGLGFVLVVSFFVNSLLESLTNKIGTSIGFDPQIGEVINFAVSFLVIAVIFAAIFKFMPDAQIQWRDVWVGAVVTAVLFTAGRIAMGYYFSYSNPGEQLGSAAGALAVILVWVYYSSMIVLLGAEFTQAWVQHSGRELIPEHGAVKFIEKTLPS